MDIKTLQGKVKKLRHDTKISGTKDTVSTSHVTNFLIDNISVTVRSNNPIALNENDMIKVVGIFDNGIFNAIAYKNNITGAIGGQSKANTTFVNIPRFIFVSIRLFVVGVASQNLQELTSGTIAFGTIFGLIVPSFILLTTIGHEDKVKAYNMLDETGTDIRKEPKISID